MAKKYYIIAVCFVSAFIAAVFVISFAGMHKHRPTIKVGILHSFTGTMAISEKPVASATLLALEEINKSGGLLGMEIEPVIADGKSDPNVFQEEAERLITKEHVKVIFGCWTSASRKMVKPVVEEYNSILFYPVQYGGLEESPNIIYLGAAPNQQLIPAIKWACDNLGKRFFLVGSDYVFPRVANKIATDVIGYFDGEVMGEEYVLLGGKDFAGIARKIREAKPDVILSTINGESNVAFFEALHEAGIPSRKVAVMSFSMSENMITAFRAYLQKNNPQDAEHTFKEQMVGTYACWNYFESIDNPLNKDFVKKFRKKFGEGYKVTDPMEAAYYGVYLWNKSVRDCGDADNTRNIVNHLHYLSMMAPEGIVSVASNNHLFKTVRIGRVNNEGDFDILWASNGPVNPDQYPDFRTKVYWENLIDGLYRKWNGRWTAGVSPGEKSER